MDNRVESKFFKFIFGLICVLLLVSIFFILYFFRETNLLKVKNNELSEKERRSQVEIQHLKKNFENLEMMVNQADKIFVDKKQSDITSDSDIYNLKSKTFFSKIEENEKLLKQKEEQFLLSVKKINKILAELSREKGNSSLFEKKYDKALYHYLRSIEYSDNIATRMALMDLVRILSNKNNKLIGHEEKINSISLTTDNKILASAGFDGVIKIWDLENLKFIKNISTDGYSINSIKFLDNVNLAYAGDNKLIKVVDIEKEMTIKTFKGHTGNITSIDWFQNKRILASASLDRTVKIWDFDKQELIHNLTNHTERVNVVKFSFGENYLASGGKDNNIFLYDINNFQVIKKFVVHSSGVNTLIFDKSDKFIISGTGSYFGGEEFVSKLIDIKSEKVIRVFNEHSDYVTNSFFLGVGDNMFLTGSNDFTFKLWGIETEDSLFTFRGHSDYVNQVIATSDSRYIISCSSDKSIRVWETGINENIDNIRNKLKNYIVE